MNGIKCLETRKKMNLEEALSIVVNEAEVSALGERTDEHLVILKACEIVREFLNKKT